MIECFTLAQEFCILIMLDFSNLKAKIKKTYTSCNRFIFAKGSKYTLI